MGWIGIVALGLLALLLLLGLMPDRAWAVLGVERCEACGGRGSWIGHSPTAPLNTFRSASTQYCHDCHGCGSVSKAVNARIREVRERDDAFWRSGACRGQAGR